MFTSKLFDFKTTTKQNKQTNKKLKFNQIKSEDSKGFKRKIARRTKSSPRKHFNQQTTPPQQQQQQPQQPTQQQQQQQSQPQQQVQQQQQQLQPQQQQQQQQQQSNSIVTNDGYTLNHEIASTSTSYTNSSGAGAASDNFKVRY